MSESNPNQHPIEFPALYQIADRRSVAAQFRHFGLVLLEYGILISTATVTLLAGLEWSNIPDLAYTSSFMVLIFIATLSHFAGQDKSWFKARAAAEAVKTASWRYMMRASPFATETAEERFRLRSDRISEIDRIISERASKAEQRHVTAAMQKIRGLDVSERAKIYSEARVHDQLDWYKRKAKINSRQSRNWYLSTCLIYAVPLALIPLGALEGGQHWPIISLFLLVGSSLLGWTKAKRFRELSTSYAQAAIEIQMMIDDADTVRSEEDLNEFVGAAETAFSREHTSWIISNK